MIRILVAITSLFSFSALANAQSVQEIVAHHIEALGGKEKLQSLNSVYQEGIAVLPSGAQLHLKTWRIYDRLYREELEFGVGSIVVIVTPRQGWVSTPSTGGAFKPLPEAQLRALQMEIDPAGALADYSAKGYKIERAGIDTVDGKTCYQVRVWFPNNQFITYSIDQKTWYILRETRKGGGVMGDGSNGAGWRGLSDGNIMIGFDDYRNTRGAYVFPFAITIGGLGRVEISKIEVNGNVNADALSRPK